MVFNIPKYVQIVLERLRHSGFDAFVVGGCVRDCLLEQAPRDWDIATSALPEQSMAALRPLRLIETGLRHGTITAVCDGQAVEVTTYRVDGPYSDGRRPDAVRFTRSLQADLSRRDFTVNAMAYHPDTGLIDCFGGREDLERRVLRCVGAPERRFSEDALRIFAVCVFPPRSASPSRKKPPPLC